MGVICICHEIYFGIICFIVEKNIWADITNTAYGWIRIVAGLILGGISIGFGWFIEVYRRG
jgi:tetrahydromethanopterin S-methyltransferase subunit E